MICLLVNSFFPPTEFCLLLKLLSRCNFFSLSLQPFVFITFWGVGARIPSAIYTLTWAMLSLNVKTLVPESKPKWNFSVSWLGVMCESHICAHGKNNTPATWLRRRWTPHDFLNPEQQWRQVAPHTLIALNYLLKKTTLRSLIRKQC